MKVQVNSKKNIILYLPEMKLDFQDIKKVEEEFRKIFLRLKYYYKIEVMGFYDVKAHIDKYYGLVLELDGEDLDYIEYLNGEIEMRIELNQEEFIYKTDDILAIPNDILKNVDIYFYDSKYYIKLKNEIDIINLIEYVECIYHNDNPFLLKEKNKIIS